MPARPDVPEEAVELAAMMRRERVRGETLPWAELPWIAKAPILADAAKDLQAAAPAIVAKAVEEKDAEIEEAWETARRYGREAKKAEAALARDTYRYVLKQIADATPTLSDDQKQTIERIRSVARDCGYAIAVHGSCERDLDLIAVPWVDDAGTAEQLLTALNEEADCMYGPPNPKAHGRVGYVLHGFAGCEYVDLSIAPDFERLRHASAYARDVAVERATLSDKDREGLERIADGLERKSRSCDLAPLLVQDISFLRKLASQGTGGEHG